MSISLLISLRRLTAWHVNWDAVAHGITAPTPKLMFRLAVAGGQSTPNTSNVLT